MPAPDTTAERGERWTHDRVADHVWEALVGQYDEDRGFETDDLHSAMAVVPEDVRPDLLELACKVKTRADRNFKTVIDEGIVSWHLGVEATPIMHSIYTAHQLSESADALIEKARSITPRQTDSLM